MITRRGLFKGLFAVAGSVVLKPFVKAEVKSKGKVYLNNQYVGEAVDFKYVTYSTPRSNKDWFRDRYIGRWDEVLSLPYIDLNDGATGHVKYTTDRSIGSRDNHLRLTSDFREKGLDINFADGSGIRVTALGSWYRHKDHWIHGSNSIDDVHFEIPVVTTGLGYILE